MTQTATPQVKTKTITCPFTVLIDSREQKPYTFANLWDGPTGRSRLIEVPTQRAALKTGDYGIKDFPRIVIERKSKEDLYSSISQGRENFVGRLERMCLEADFAAVVVEAEWSELLNDPPPHTQYSPKSLGRTIMAWMTRYTMVQWLMLPSRAHAEAFTFRLLERYWRDQTGIPKDAARWNVKTLRRWESDLAAETLQSESSEITQTEA
jgi:hypothetical protein